MTFRPADYPYNWASLRRQVRTRAHDRCERCGVSNHDEGARKLPREDAIVGASEWYDVTEIEMLSENERLAIFGGREPHSIRIVCTTAHKPGTSKMSQDINDMEWLCQRCHLNQDRSHHLAVQRANRDQRRGPLQLEVGG